MPQDGLMTFSKLQFAREVVNAGAPGTAVTPTVAWRGPGSFFPDQPRVYPEEHVGYTMGIDRSYIPMAKAPLTLSPTPLTFEQFPYLLAAGIRGRSNGVQDGAGSDYLYTYTIPATISDWEVVGTGIAAVNATSKFTDSGNGFGFIGVGDIVYITGTTGGTNDDYYRVTAAAAGEITVATAPADESAGQSITVTLVRQAYTALAGDNKRCWRATYCRPLEINVEWEGTTDAGAVEMSASMLGRQWASYATGFAALSLPTVEVAVAPKIKYYIDAIGGTIGTTQKTGMFIGGRWRLMTGLHPVFSGASSGLSFETLEMRSPPEVTLELDMLETAEHLTQIDNWLNGTSILLRVAVVGGSVTTPGTTYSTKMVHFDCPGSWENFSEPKTLEGAVYRTGTFRPRYNSTAALGPSVLVVNELSALT